eukprot:3184048-Pyramimonas_sp.AAC.1
MDGGGGENDYRKSQPVKGTGERFVVDVSRLLGTLLSGASFERDIGTKPLAYSLQWLPFVVSTIPPVDVTSVAQLREGSRVVAADNPIRVALKTSLPKTSLPKRSARRAVAS